MPDSLAFCRQRSCELILQNFDKSQTNRDGMVGTLPSAIQLVVLAISATVKRRLARP